MKFTIITPTYERPEMLERAVESVLNQTHQNFDIIIINDSPEFDYTEFENKYKNNNKIIYIKNEKNSGVNFSRNIALEKTKDLHSDYTIFLDDDDWLYSDALENINRVLEKESYDWLATNRSVNDKSLVTRKNTPKQKYDYFFDVLMFKNIKGDMTHAIKSQLATQFRFSTKVKQGEEWLYFVQFPFNFTYRNINTTASEGYAVNGLTDILKTKQKSNTKSLWKESLNLKSFIYLTLRTLKLYTK